MAAEQSSLQSASVAGECEIEGKKDALRSTMLSFPGSQQG
jgi:hypothetical protein